MAWLWWYGFLPLARDTLQWWQSEVSNPGVFETSFLIEAEVCSYIVRRKHFFCFLSNLLCRNSNALRSSLRFPTLPLLLYSTVLRTETLERLSSWPPTFPALILSQASLNTPVLTKLDQSMSNCQSPSLNRLLLRQTINSLQFSTRSFTHASQSPKERLSIGYQIRRENISLHTPDLLGLARSWQNLSRKTKIRNRVLC